MQEKICLSVCLQLFPFFINMSSSSSSLKFTSSFFFYFFFGDMSFAHKLRYQDEFTDKILIKLQQLPSSINWICILCKWCLGVSLRVKIPMPKRSLRHHICLSLFEFFPSSSTYFDISFFFQFLTVLSSSVHP